MNTRFLIRTVFSVLSWVVLAIVAVAGVWAFVRTWQKVARPAPEVLQGQIEATEIDVSSKIPGRLDAIAVIEGAAVRKGDLIATLDSPEINAKLAQVQATRAAAAAQRDKADRVAHQDAHQEKGIRAGMSSEHRLRQKDQPEKRAGEQQCQPGRDPGHADHEPAFAG